MRPLRILHVVFSSRLAGSERYCADLANRQAVAGHEVHVAGVAGSPLADALDSTVTFHGLSTRFFRGLRVRRLAARLGVDICHGHLSAACKALGRSTGEHWTVATLHVGYKRHQHERLDALICVNHAQAARLGNYRGVVRTIFNWLPRAPVQGGTSDLRAELGLAADTFLVCAVGRLHASKGMDVLVRAFKASAGERAVLAIFGEGPQRAELERLAAGDARIHLPGHRADVGGALRACDLFVSPSREESFGLAILEAMGAGAPVIATAAEGPSEFLRGQPVPLVEPGSVEELAEEIAAAQRAFAAGTLARIDYDLRDFSPEHRLEAIDELYAQLVGAHRWRPATRGALAAAT